MSLSLSVKFSNYLSIFFLSLCLHLDMLINLSIYYLFISSVPAFNILLSLFDIILFCLPLPLKTSLYYPVSMFLTISSSLSLSFYRYFAFPHLSLSVTLLPLSPPLSISPLSIYFPLSPLLSLPLSP